MTNEGEQEHFLVLWRIPDDKTFEEYEARVVAPFDSLDTKYRSGEIDRAGYMAALGEALPEWYVTSVEGGGGPGLTAPGRTSRTTVKLEPGTYAMECYVRNSEGEFHNVLGMLRLLTVTQETKGTSPPEADVELTLSNYAIATEGELVAEARLGEGTSTREVAAWLDWVDELRAPAPTEFLGGAEQMPAGREAYVTFELEPGRYAWLSEAYSDRGMVEEFAVE